MSPAGTDPVVRSHHKGFPAAAVGRPVSQLVGAGLVGGPAGGLSTPVLLLRRDLLDANIGALQRLCAGSGLSLAPHVKTTMSPEIFDRQAAAGAWAATVATPTQLRTVREWGVRRLLLANQLVDRAAIDWLGAELDRDAGLTAYCYVDSVAGLELLAETLAARGQRRPLPVLVELGLPGGRTGERDLDRLPALAAQVVAVPQLRLAGVAGFEGVIDARAGAGGLAEVEQYLRRLRAAADRVDREQPQLDELVVTVGGSAYLELVRDVFHPDWRAGRQIRVVLRSGCYVTHDSGAYADFRALAADRADPVRLAPALELWSRVLSCPEPGLALVDLGRRDAGTDAGLPVPRWWLPTAGRGGSVPEPSPEPRPAPAMTLVALNDQHGYLRADPATPELPLAPGDLVGFGVSHPCTTLDKWRLIPLVDAERRLVAAARTMF